MFCPRQMLLKSLLVTIDVAADVFLGKEGKAKGQKESGLNKLWSGGVDGDTRTSDIYPQMSD